MFPFYLSPVDCGAWVESPKGFRKTWEAARPDDMTWYAYGVEVVSTDSVIFSVYNMLDCVSGGLGCVFAKVPASVGEDTIREAVAQQAVLLATARRNRERAAEEQRLIANYAAEIVAQVYERTTPW